MTDTLEKKNTAILFNSNTFAVNKPSFSRNGDGTLAVKNVAIFRTGTFRDSYGDQHTYESMHMAQLVANYNLLKSQGILPDVPVRCDHPGFIGNVMRDVIGYVDALATVELVNPSGGATETYVLADFQILDRSAADAVETGLWRNRSAEISRYLTNSESEYWPVLTGFAYVDIPAVEGLNFSKMAARYKDTDTVVVNELTEDTVADENPSGTDNGGSSNHSAAPQRPPVPGAPFTFSLGEGKSTTDFGQVQNFINGLIAEKTALTTEVTDLKAFQASTKKANREDFVNGLGEKSVVLASQIEGLKEMVEDMTDEQFGKFQAVYSAAPVLPTLATHGVTPQAGGEQNEGEQVDPNVEAAKRQYAHLKIGGMKPDALANTRQAKVLKAAGIDLDNFSTADVKL